MNPWDIDPDLYLPVYRPLVRRLMEWLKAWRGRRSEAAGACSAGCRG